MTNYSKEKTNFTSDASLMDASETIASNFPGEPIDDSADHIDESFDGMGLHDNLLRGVYAYGFEKPSAIQQSAIRPMGTGRDIIAQAQSGTGKTATFTLGILQMIDPDEMNCQALVLAPTRELAVQIMKVASALADFMPRVKVHACVGGTAVRDDIRAIQNGAQLIVGKNSLSISIVFNIFVRGIVQNRYTRANSRPDREAKSSGR